MLEYFERDYPVGDMQHDFMANRNDPQFFARNFRLVLRLASKSSRTTLAIEQVQELCDFYRRLERENDSLDNKNNSYQRSEGSPQEPT